MALRLRRGTNAERLTITPESGEIIYVTDSKKLYVGDGSTVGGNLVSGVNNIVDDTTPQLGGDLDLNGNDIVGNGNIDINGTITATGNINLGDGAGGDVISVGGDVSGNVIPSADESFTLGSPGRRWQAIWGSSAVISGQIDAVSVNANLIADDSTVIFDSSTGILNGRFTGIVDGELTGSVFGDNSTLIVDGVNNSINTALITTDINSITLRPTTTGTAATIFRLESDSFSNQIQYTRTDATVQAGNTRIGQMNFAFTDNVTPETNVAVFGVNKDSFFFLHDVDGNFSETSGFNYDNGTGDGRFGINKFDPEATLHVNGDGLFNGDVKAAAFKGTLAGDDSAIVFDGVTGGLILANIDVIGNTGATPGDTGTVDSWLSITVNGVAKFIPLYS